MAMVTSVFKTAITLADVRVRQGPILPFQGKYAVTPMGGIYYPTKEYLEDYSIARIEDRHLFMHEMVHIWQYQMGMWSLCGARAAYWWITNMHWQTTKYYPITAWNNKHPLLLIIIF